MTALRHLKIAPTRMRLHEWIALERGYFQEAGIDPVVRWDIVSGIMGSWQGKQYLERPQDQPFVGAAEPVDILGFAREHPPADFGTTDLSCMRFFRVTTDVPSTIGAWPILTPG